MFPAKFSQVFDWNCRLTAFRNLRAGFSHTQWRKAGMPMCRKIDSECRACDTWRDKPKMSKVRRCASDATTEKKSETFSVWACCCCRCCCLLSARAENATRETCQWTLRKKANFQVVLKRSNGFAAASTVDSDPDICKRS